MFYLKVGQDAEGSQGRRKLFIRLIVFGRNQHLGCILAQFMAISLGDFDLANPLLEVLGFAIIGRPKS